MANLHTLCLLAIALAAVVLCNAVSGSPSGLRSGSDEVGLSGVTPMPASTLSYVRALLISFVSQRQVAAPANVFCNTCLIYSWLKHSASGDYIEFHISQVETALKHYPIQLQNRLISLLHSGSGTKFDIFSMDISPTHDLLQSYIVAVRRVNDMVDVAVLAVDLQAGLVPKTQLVYERKCSPTWFCKNVAVPKPRANNLEEIHLIKATFQSEAFKLFKDIATTIPA